MSISKFGIEQEKEIGEVRQEQEGNKKVLSRKGYLALCSSVKKRRILSALRKGTKSPSVIADEWRNPKGYQVLNSKQIWAHLQELKDYGIVERVSGGLYQLTIEGINFVDKEIRGE